MYPTPEIHAELSVDVISHYATLRFCNVLLKMAVLTRWGFLHYPFIIISKNFMQNRNHYSKREHKGLSADIQSSLLIAHRAAQTMVYDTLSPSQANLEGHLRAQC